MKTNETYRRSSTFFLTIFSVLLLVACSGESIKMYSGEALGKARLAFLDSSGTLKAILPKSATVVVNSVDNKSTNMQKSAIHPRIELLPGKHTLEIELLRSINLEYSDDYGSTLKEYKIKKEISFKAEAGHYYQIYGLLDPDQTFPWYTWIEDKTGGKIVAGKRPKI